MRIGIEAQRLFRPEKHGMDRAALELIKNLQQIDRHNEYFIFVRPDKDCEVIEETPNFKIIQEDAGSFPAWEQLRLPKLAKKYKCDILHCTSNTGPVLASTPLMTTVHDIIYLEENLLCTLKSKATNYQKFGNLYRKFIVPRIVRKSLKIITVSAYEQENISARFGLKDQDKLAAIHNGVSIHFKRSAHKERITTVKEKYQLPKRYMLHFGSADPRKNTKRTLAAFGRYLNESCEEFKLVLMGYDEKQLQADLEDLNMQDLARHITLPGYVSDKDLPMLYQLAKVFLFPSLREGFGIPVIEAMACGTPVITSNTSSMPEIAGQAAHLIDPYCVDEILNGITAVLSNPNYRGMLVAEGLKQAEGFSWENMANRVLETYISIFNQTQKTRS